MHEVSKVLNSKQKAETTFSLFLTKSDWLFILHTHRHFGTPEFRRTLEAAYVAGSGI